MRRHRKAAPGRTREIPNQALAYTREDCRELSRIIRDDLIHLGLVDSDRSAPLAAGARASAGDLIVARENDHQLVTDPGHTLANGDRFVVDAVTGEGLLADCLGREASEDSATEYQRKSLVRADHLGLLHARWADQVRTADYERYQRIVQDALPEEWRGQLSPQATWLYRTMKAAELAGLDAAEVTQTAIRSRSLEGTRDVASVLDARMRAMVEPLVPLPLSPWSERVPEIADPERQEYVRRLAEAMDQRTERIGEHAVQAQPDWALRALGSVPEDPGERLDWQQRASAIGAYRELYGAGDQADSIGPEPAGSSPEQRAAWHAGCAALTRTDTVDVRTLPEASLWHMRDSYKAETEWAPPHVGRQLRGIRLAAEDASQLAIRSQAEAAAATDAGTAERHTRMAASAEALQPAYRRIEARLEEAMDDRRAWEQITAGPRRLAVAADSELRRRNPDKPIEPLRSAEPRPPEDYEITKAQPEAGRPAETPEWATQLAEQRRAFQEKLAERQNVMVPDEDPDYRFLGQAWPWQKRDPDAILQPPKPELRPCAGIQRLTGYELPEREAGS